MVLDKIQSIEGEFILLGESFSGPIYYSYLIVDQGFDRYIRSIFCCSQNLQFLG